MHLIQRGVKDKRCSHDATLPIHPTLSRWSSFPRQRYSVVCCVGWDEPSGELDQSKDPGRFEVRVFIEAPSLGQ